MPLEAPRFLRNDVDVAISELWGALTNHLATIVLVVLLAMAGAFAYLSMRESIYQSTATLIIDPARPNILASQQITEMPVVDSAVVDSAVEIIKSDFVALDVAKRLKLASDPEFTRETGFRKLLQPLRDLLLPRNAINAAQAERTAANSILRDLGVRRIGLTYVVQVTSQSLNPEKSALLANSFVDAYLDNQLSVKMDMTKRASSWLETRTEELRQKVIEADNAVQLYRSQSGLVETAGKLPLDQQLSELTSKLSAARSEETTSKVKAESIGTLLAQGDFASAALSAPPESRVSKLRDQLGELEGRENEIADRVGRQHRLTIEARNQTEAVRTELQKEVENYHDGLSNGAVSAAAQVAQLEAELKNMTSGQMELGEKSIRLRELERDSSSVRQLYETFLTRLKEIHQQETLAMQDARVIASATPATNPSNISGTLVLAGAIGIGLLLGMVAAMLKDRFDPLIRNEEEAEAATGRRVLAVLDDMKQSTRKKDVSGLGSLLGGGSADQKKTRPSVNRLMTYAVDQPFSPFAESLRQLRLALNHGSDRRGKVVGVVASLQGEGKSTVASNLAHQYAANGTRTILIDCDLRSPGLSEQLCPSEPYGLPDVLTGGVAWQSAARVDPATGLALLAGKSSVSGGNLSELLMLPTFEDLLEQLSQAYEVIILDFAPIGLVSDARAVARLVDMFVLVTSCGIAAKNDVSQILAHAPEIHEKVLGVVLNRATRRSGAGEYPVVRGRTAYAAAKAGFDQ